MSLREIPIKKVVNGEEKVIGTAVFQDGSLIALVSPYSSSDLSYDGEISFGEGFQNLFGLYDVGRSDFLSAATNSLISYYANDPFFDVEAIREILRENFFTTARDLAEWGIQKAWINVWIGNQVSSAAAPYLLEFAAGFTDSIISQVIVTYIGEEIIQGAIGLAAPELDSPAPPSFDVVFADYKENATDAYGELSETEPRVVVTSSASIPLVGGGADDTFVATNDSGIGVVARGGNGTDMLAVDWSGDGVDLVWDLTVDNETEKTLANGAVVQSIERLNLPDRFRRRCHFHDQGRRHHCHRRW